MVIEIMINNINNGYDDNNDFVSSVLDLPESFCMSFVVMFLMKKKTAKLVVSSFKCTKLTAYNLVCILPASPVII